MCEDPDSVLTHHLDTRLDTRRDDYELETHPFQLELDRQVLELLERLLGRENSWLCGSLVYYDEIEPDFDDNERIEYLKRITMEEPRKPPRARACPRPLHSERKARDAARRGHERRERGARPTRARP